MTSGTSKFEVMGGSVPGRSHQRAGRNNQDAFAWLQQEACLVAVLSDGCSASRWSEVGAQLGARLLAETLLQELRAGRDQDGEALLERARLELSARIADLVRGMGGRFGQTLQDYFLFTLVGLAVGRRQAWLFALGDGYAALNGEELVLGPFANNEPPYLAYGLLDGLGVGPRFQILRTIPTSALRTALIGTDGLLDLRAAAERPLPGKSETVGPLSQFWTEDRYAKNPDLVRRRLAMANRPPNGLLPDDTTLVAVRSREPAPLLVAAEAVR